MSVYTSTDRKIDEIKDLLKNATIKIVEIISDDDIYNDYKEDYIENLQEIAIQLAKMKRKL